MRLTIRDASRGQLGPVWRSLRRGDSAALRETFRGALGQRHPCAGNRVHAQAAMAWLCAAQDATEDGGVSAFYSLADGIWAPSYPETTGYIIPTFFDYAVHAADERYRDRAIRMADWLLTIQLECGAFPMGPLWADLERKPIVFDTGQILHGLIRAYEETGRARYLDAARRASDWLVAIQDDDGSWRRHTFLDQKHAYNARTAWALLRAWPHGGDSRYRESAANNLKWVLAQQTEGGWLKHAGFSMDEVPLTHTLAYTVEGLLESALLLTDAAMLAAARRTADALLACQSRDGYLRGRYEADWSTDAQWSCLTGTAQMAGVWLRLFQATNQAEYRQAGSAANGYVARCQQRDPGRVALDGGIAGSFPIYEDYHPYLIVNWAAKFFVDSACLEDRIDAAGGAT